MNLRDTLFGILILSTVAIFPMENYSQTEKRNPIIIVVDPGHGGRDSGTVGMNGIQEKEVVLKIALEMIKISKSSSENEFKIYLTRYKDTLISLSDRTKLAKALKADVFISLHCNHSNYSDDRGLEVYVSNKISQHSKESILLAYRIQKDLGKELGFKNRGVKFADFHVLRESIAYHPAVLLELGFLSNWEEEIFLAEPENIDYLALSILNPILKILNLSVK